MKTTNVKAIVAKFFTVGMLAGAVVMAAPAAQAQGVRFGVGIGFGHPYYHPPVVVGPVYAPGYGYGPGFYARRNEIIRHDEWVRAHEYGRRPYTYYGR